MKPFRYTVGTIGFLGLAVVIAAAISLYYSWTVKKSTNAHLVKAVQQNNVEFVKTYLDNGGSPYLKLNKKDDLLFLACYSGQRDIVHLIIKHGFRVNYFSEEGETPLLAAMWTHDKILVKLLIEAGCDVNVVNKNNWTPLTKAIYGGNDACLEIAEELIRAGASVNAINSNQPPPLALAVRWGNLKFIQLLIESGADTNAFDPQTGKGVLDSTEQNEAKTKQLISNYIHRTTLEQTSKKY